MNIKIALALEVASERDRDDLLYGLQALLARLRKAPKYKVKLSYEYGNEEIGDALPLDLGALGVPTDVPPLPLEQYLNSLEA